VVIDHLTTHPFVEETFTDPSGHFRARLDLRAVARDAGRDPDDVQGTYTVQASTFAAETVAEAESNALTITR
jgi:alkanesulfonate monooxygenase SsuD/methylene tetrahydromethanopterin reductase-like flavin-dependent oxidoreductase (luciferase family)